MRVREVLEYGPVFGGKNAFQMAKRKKQGSDGSEVGCADSLVLS